MEQHVLSEWILKAFGPAGSLTAYDKATNTFSPTTPDEFLIEIDAHDVAIEKAFAAIETPASQAALRLTKYFKQRPAGIYAMDDEVGSFPTRSELAPVGSLEGMTLLVAGRVESWPRQGDRRLLAAYLALMYQRSPKLAEATRQWGIEFDAGAREALAAELPWMRPDLSEILRSAKDRDLRRVALIGPRLAAANWFVVRAPADQSFILSDCPVVASIALGHDDTWRAILEDTTFVVMMPLGPTLALVIGPKALIPVSGPSGVDLTRMINRHVWRAADRYVLARDQLTLEAASPGGEDRRSTVPVTVDPVGVRTQAAMIVHSIVRQVMLERMGLAEFQRGVVIRWDGCRVVIGGDLRLPRRSG